MNVSIVSVSLFAASPHEGHLVFTKLSILAKGSPLETSSLLGSRTGSSSSGTGTNPQSLQCTIGIGAPQYL